MASLFADEYPQVTYDDGDVKEIKIAETKRTFLIHLNLELPEGDERSSDDVASAIAGAIEVGSDNEILKGIKIDIPLVEEI